MRISSEDSATAPGSEAAADQGKAKRETNAAKKNDRYWKKALTPEQYQVTRQKGTERPFSGEYYKTTTPGVYHCLCCGAPLFQSETKFDAGCGWPSFYEPADPKAVETERDNRFFMQRTEVHCSNCGAHLGHVFDDGPQPTGLRYCINSTSLKLEKKKETGGKDAPKTKAPVAPAGK